MGTAALPSISGEITDRFAVQGMTCASCATHLEAALAAVPGVRSVRIDLADGTATVRRDPVVGSFARLRAAADAAGYGLAEPASIPGGDTRRPRLWPASVLVGLLGALGLLAFYLGVITLAQGWTHALQQLADDRAFVGAIALGFGTQLALFTYLRRLHTHAPAGGVAASTGTSTTAMLACCAHHLADLLPLLGLSGAAIFLNGYKTPLLWLGIGLNLLGIPVLLRQLRQARTRACPTH